MRRPLPLAPLAANQDVHRHPARRNSSAQCGAASSAYSWPDDWCLIHEFRANTLIVGPEDLTRTALGELRPLLAEPVITVSAMAPGPIAPPEGGTFILSDVWCLSLPDQHRLLAALDGRSAAMHVISTTTSPILAQVLRHAFLETLYYRLNVLYFELGVPQQAAARAIPATRP